MLLHLLAVGPAFAQTTAAPPVFAPRIDGAPPSAESACEQAGSQAERAHALPAGLLLAIGRVESGRWDAERQRVVPWPWAIDAEGAGALIDTKAAAVARADALRDAGIRNIDVGCFQINLASHPFAFADLNEAFDPVANADYAGRFLGDLHARYGDWNAAVAAYHSTQPERGIPYRQLVFANWPPGDQLLNDQHLNDQRRDDQHQGDHATSTDVQIGPLVVEFRSGARMRIWTPGSAATTSEVVPIASAAAIALPHVIVGKPDPR